MDELQVVTPSEAVSIAHAQVQSQVDIARRYPRDLETFKNNLYSIATSDPETAKSCIYSRPVSGSAVATGPSIRIAEMVLQLYGHLMVQTMVTEVADRTLTAQARVWDMQTNTMYTADVKRSIIGSKSKGSKRYDDSMIVVTGQAACAIALRNAIFKVVPWSLVKGTYDACMKVAMGNPEDTKKNFKTAVTHFKTKHGKTEKDLLKFLGRESVAAVTTMDIGKLSGIASALKSDEISVDDAFADKQTEPTEKAKDPEPEVKGEPEKTEVEKMFSDDEVSDAEPAEDDEAY